MALDPRTASVSYVEEDLGTPEEPCSGRVYYWYDPDFKEGSRVDDAVFRRDHPEISDREWAELFAAAFDRGEKDSQEQLILSTRQRRDAMANRLAMKQARSEGLSGAEFTELGLQVMLVALFELQKETGSGIDRIVGAKGREE
jgi:hypothetical protein